MLPKPHINYENLPPDLASWLVRQFGDKRGMLYPAATATQLPISLAAARPSGTDTGELEVTGDFVYFDIETTGKIYIKFNNPQMPWIPMKAGQGVSKFPFQKLFIKNTAQASCIGNLVYGYGADFLATPQQYQWYDRNPSTFVKAYSTFGVAPAGFTTRWTYTCPAGKKCMVESMAASTLRATAAAPVGLAYCRAGVAAGGFTHSAYAWIMDNAVGAKENMNSSGSVMLLPGDSSTGATEDQSTGGTVNYSVSAKFTEFDL